VGEIAAGGEEGFPTIEVKLKIIKNNCKKKTKKI